MSNMKIKHILRAVSGVYSLQPNSDYSHFIPSNGAETMMLDAWKTVGHHMSAAVLKVGKDVEKKKKNSATACT